MFSTSGFFSRTFNCQVIGFLAVILLAVFLAPQAWAAKPCKPNPNKGITCEPVSDPMPPGKDSQVRLMGEFEDNFSRHCESEQSPLSSRGNYTCDNGGEVLMSIHELGEPVANRKNQAWICSVLQLDNGHLPMPVDSYIIGWTDSCGDGTCGIEVRIVSTDPIMHTITFGVSDQMEVTLYAEAENVLDNNPFEQNLVLDVHSVEIDFKKTGSTRSAVICNYDVDSAPGHITVENLSIP